MYQEKQIGRLTHDELINRACRFCERFFVLVWPRTLGKSPLLLSSLLVKLLDVSIPESLVALS